MEKSKIAFTPEASLQLIRESILSSRKNIKSDSFHFLLWGWLISLASVLQYVIARIGVQGGLTGKIGLYSAVNWLGLVLIGFIVQALFVRRKNRTQRVFSYVDRFLAALWICSSVVILLMVFLSFSVGSYPAPFILGVVAIPTTVTGFITRFRPFIFGGFVFLAGAVVAVLIQNEYQNLVNATAIVLGYLVPGYMMRFSKEEDDV